ncbi:spinster family MFS transporter [Rhodohalobacter halophilus]|uniref:spinster family MFS transporter n=1 Tax=Rhodohalobacter halophilus TaxID=1812810 RepID=UPI00083FC23D|nr:MFS transporter [Rhodohalobacter halophilus]
MKKHAAYGTVLLFTIIYILSFVDRQIVAVLGTQIRDTLTLNNLQIGLLYGPAFSFVYALAGIPMGRITDRTSRKMMISIGLFVWSLMTVLSGFAASFAFLITARIFVGLSQSMLSPAVYSYLADTFSHEKRATVFSIYASGIFIGVGLSFLIGGNVSMQYDWRIAMIVVGIPGLILAPLTWFLVKEPSRSGNSQKPEESVWVDIRTILGKKSVRLHLIGFSFLACMGYTILAFVGNVFNDIHNRPDLISSYGWFMFGVGSMVILSGKLADILAETSPNRRFLMGVFAALGGLPFYGLGLYAASPQAAFLLMGIGVLFASSYNGVAAAIIQYFVPDSKRALAGGIYLFVISIAGFGIGPPVTGWLMDYVYSGDLAVAHAMFTVIATCSAGATIFLFWAMKYYDEDVVK